MIYIYKNLTKSDKVYVYQTTAFWDKTINKLLASRYIYYMLRDKKN